VGSITCFLDSPRSPRDDHLTFCHNQDEVTPVQYLAAVCKALCSPTSLNLCYYAVKWHTSSAICYSPCLTPKLCSAFRDDGPCKSRSTGRPARELCNLQLFLPLLMYLVAFIVDRHGGVSIHPSHKACSRLISNA
jgi:hypothetical protein